VSNAYRENSEWFFKQCFTYAFRSWKQIEQPVLVMQ
jgi:hypothetical protein